VVVSSGDSLFTATYNGMHLTALRAAGDAEAIGTDKR